MRLEAPLQMLRKTLPTQWVELKPNLPPTGQILTSLKPPWFIAIFSYKTPKKVTEYETLISFAISIQHLSPCLRRKHEREVETQDATLPALFSCAVSTANDSSLFPLQTNLTLLKSGAFTCLFNYFFRIQTQKISTFQENS